MAASNIEGGNMTSDSIGGGGGSRDTQLVLIPRGTPPLIFFNRFTVLESVYDEVLENFSSRSMGSGWANISLDEYPYSMVDGGWSCPKWN